MPLAPECPTFSMRVSSAAGSELRRLRMEAGLSQSEVARRLGSVRQVVRRAENGQHGCTLASCAAQAAA